MSVEYIRYLNLPQPPHNMLHIYKEETNLWPDGIDEQGLNKYYRTTEGCELIDEWCKNNILKNGIFAIHRITKDLLPHKDQKFTKNGITMHCECKLTYLMDTGGENVITAFWSDDYKNKLKEYVIEPFKWHLLQCNRVHSVSGINRIRWGISAHIFHDAEKYNESE